MGEELKPKSPEVVDPAIKLIDVSKELYEGGKADESKLASYVEVAKQKGLLDKEKLDLTGGTLMTIYMAVAAEAAKPGSKVKELAFNNPGREGRLVLWNEAMAKDVPALKKSLMADQEVSKIDAGAPSQVLDLRLTFREDPEGPEMVNAAKAQDVMKQVIAQLRAIKEQGTTTVRLTGFPVWLAEGAAFAAVNEGMQKVIAFAPGKEVVVYDATSSMMGKVEVTPSQKLEANNPEAKISDIATWHDVQNILKIELPNNEITINGIELANLKPDAGLRMFDSLHSVSKSLTVGGVEVFQHRDPRTHDLVAKGKAQNPELQFLAQREAITLDVHSMLEAAGGDADKTAIELAKQAVNKASILTFSGITTPVELALAGKAAHAAHGMIQELRYQDGGEVRIVKSWKGDSK